MKKILLLASILIFSCTNSDQDKINRIHFNQNAFEKNRKLWREKDITNYEFSQSYSSGSEGPNYLRVKCSVKDRKFDSSLNLDDNGAMFFNGYKTIDEVYEGIEKKVSDLKKEDNNGRSFYISIKYNKTYNYPTEVSYSEAFTADNLVVGGLANNITINDFNIK